MDAALWVLIGMGLFIIGVFTYLYLSVNGKFDRFKRKKK